MIPISAQLKYNIEVICEYIVQKIPAPLRDFSSAPQLIVIRSFDVNKPGSEVHELKGGVAGGSILRGVLKVRVGGVEVRVGGVKVRVGGVEVRVGGVKVRVGGVKVRVGGVGTSL